MLQLDWTVWIYYFLIKILWPNYIFKRLNNIFLNKNIIFFRSESLKKMRAKKKKNSSEIYIKETSLVKKRFKGNQLKAYYYKKVGLVDLSTYGGKIKFEFWLSRQRWAGRPNSNFIFPPSVLKSTSRLSYNNKPLKEMP